MSVWRRLGLGRWAAVGCALAVLASTGLAAAAPVGGGTAGAAVAIVCPMAPASGGALPACWPPRPVLGPGQMAVRGNVHILMAMCAVGAPPSACGRIVYLTAPEGQVRLTGATASLRSGEAVIVVGTWSVAGGELTVDVKYAVPVRPCPPLPRGTANAQIACPL